MALPRYATDGWLDQALSGLDEETLQYFLVTARCGCFMQAARSLSIKPTQLREKLARLGERSGHALFIHQNSALVLSDEGRLLLEHLAPCRLPRAETQPLVRLAVAEPLLRDILGRNLLAFLRQRANVRLELSLLGAAPAIATTPVDLQLWLAEPGAGLPEPGFAAAQLECLARLEYLPHIGKRYSRERRVPRNLAGLEDYLLVDQSGHAGVAALEPWNRLVAQREGGVARLDSYEMLRQMIQWSACIGLLPHYVQLLDRNLRPLPGLFERPMALQAWLAVRAGEERREEVRRLADLVRFAFDERREWF